MTQAITVPVVVHTFGGSSRDVDPDMLCVIVGTEPMTGYIECGRTTLTFIPDSRESRIAREVAALQQRMAQKRADAEKEVTELQNRINNLLAITYEAPQPTPVTPPWQQAEPIDHAYDDVLTAADLGEGDAL